MPLSVRASKMMRTLPDYYWGNATIEDIIQALANEFDRLNAKLDVLAAGMCPATATDELGMLPIWEQVLDLPVRPADRTLAQRQGDVKAAFRRLDAVSAASVLALFAGALGAPVAIDRSTPGVLRDTITIPFADGTYEAQRAREITAAVWPAHRTAILAYDP